MQKLGAELAVYALEQIGIKYTFGIPGTHTTEIYDQLNNSEKITPVLVTHEGGGSFMADGVSRTNDFIGGLTIGPAAGTTHAMSGIGEAFLDGIPMLVISGGTRRDSGKSYQLHQIDQEKIIQGLVKKYFLIESHEAIIPTIYEAYELAISEEPGPVFVEIPIEIQMFKGEVSEMKPFVSSAKSLLPSTAGTDFYAQVKQAVDLLCAAENPGIFVGWGAVDSSELTVKIADALVAPVSTTLQGISSFPHSHPLHTGFGFGPASVPAAQNAFKTCDCLIAIGTRFSEIPTGSFGLPVPENLIHIDINPEVFHKNYPAKVAIEGDSGLVLKVLLEELLSREHTPSRELVAFSAKIKADKTSYFAEWTLKPNLEKVSPGFFFRSLRKQLADDAYIVIDDGKHTFLTAELMPINHPRHMISPTDFNCMGYCVPAAIGVKLTHPDKQVAAIVGDGAFLMTCMETLTASSNGLGLMFFIFHDGELGQISQFQSIPLNRKTCTVLADYKVEGIAMATGCHFVSMKNDQEIDSGIAEALRISASGKPVIVDINIDYSKRTMLTKGVVKTNLARFPLGEKLRFVGRAVKRHILG